MFEWDRGNLRKFRAHRISRDEAEQAVVNDALPIYEQDVEGEPRFVLLRRNRRAAPAGRNCDRAPRPDSGGDGL
jgi:hypothetical protein